MKILEGVTLCLQLLSSKHKDDMHLGKKNLIRYINMQLN